MPPIFDNIHRPFLPDLREKIDTAARADFCVGYFNLRGWQAIDDKIAQLTGGKGAQCRLLVGMMRHPHEELRRVFSLDKGGTAEMTQGQAHQLKLKLAQEFRQQLMLGLPTNQDEEALQRLKTQLQAGQVVVKLFLPYPLHAKLYLLHYGGPQPRIAYLGSSNLTFSGLQGQGELNVDLRNTDETQMLANWFEERWNERLCIDISAELIQIIEESWAGGPIPPYHIYLKMAYHLSQEAQQGAAEFNVPAPFDKLLFDYQQTAVQLAARHLNQRNGVLIGDVVGLGKTLMATALAKLFQEDQHTDTLIICPKNLERMWQTHVDLYRLRAKIVPISQVQNSLPELRRYALLVIDESHNLRNREGRRYAAIKDYMTKNECRTILLSATPYNKDYADLGNQLRLFIDPTADLGIRPERLIRELGITEFNRRFENTPPRTLAAFEKSEYADDWRELMRLFMVRRTRGFIRDTYAKLDPENGRRYLTYADGRRSYFPTRHPRRITFALDESNPADQYARLYRADVVEAINQLHLSRYGLGLYVAKRPPTPPTPAEKQILDNLSRGGKRLMGFSRTNLFKRLESSGHAFQLSVERHILRNFLFLHAIEHKLELPIGTQDVSVLDGRLAPEEARPADEDLDQPEDGALVENPFDPADYAQRAAQMYQLFATQYKRRYTWIRPDLFDTKALATALRQDAEALLAILMVCGRWDPARDSQLAALEQLLTQEHPHDKVLIFSQFADTVRYLETHLQQRGIQGGVAGVTGDSADPTLAAHRFSPASNGQREKIAPADELRVLIATDVLSEGQNLQDAFIVVNYDLPWAIIRLIQRAGRVDRIGQQAEHIYSYAMWPADGIEQIIKLRQRLRHRLQQNAEVVGTDERFFEDEATADTLRGLYSEQTGLLDDTGDNDIDLVSHAYQIWQHATAANPQLIKEIAKMADVVYSAKAHQPQYPTAPAGTLLFLRTNFGQNALAWVDEQGEPVSQSQFDILQAAACTLDEPALPRPDHHHALVEQATQKLLAEQQSMGVQLGRPSGARFKVYERLKNHALNMPPLLAQLSQTQLLNAAVEQLGTHPLREAAREQFNRQLRLGITDQQLVNMAVALFEEDKLCVVHDETNPAEAQIICSLSLVGNEG